MMNNLVIFSIYNFLLVSWRLEKIQLGEHPQPSQPFHHMCSSFSLSFMLWFQIIPIYLRTKHTQNRYYHQAISKAIPFISALVDCFRSSGCNTTARPIQKHQGTLPNDQAMVLYPPLPSHKCLGLKRKKKGDGSRNLWSNAEPLYKHANECFSEQ